MSEEWQRWCMLNGVQSMPAPIAAVQQFVDTIQPLGKKRVWEIVQDISQDHYLKGFADPTLYVSVKVPGDFQVEPEPPRAWPAERKTRFLELPEDWQRFLAEHDKHRERTVRLAMNAAHDARTDAGLPKLPKDYYHEKRTQTSTRIAS